METIDSHLSMDATIRGGDVVGTFDLLLRTKLPFAVVSDTPSVIYHEKLPLTSSPNRRSVFQVTVCPS